MIVSNRPVAGIHVPRHLKTFSVRKTEVGRGAGGIIFTCAAEVGCSEEFN